MPTAQSHHCEYHMLLLLLLLDVVVDVAASVCANTFVAASSKPVIAVLQPIDLRIRDDCMVHTSFAMCLDAS